MNQKNNTQNVAAVIMASGDSRRWGAEDKLLAPFQGKPLVFSIMNTVNQIAQIQEKILVTRSQAIQKLCSETMFPCYFHDQPLLSDTIRLGVTAIYDSDGCLFFQADQPLVTVHSIQNMIDIFQKNPQKIIRLTNSGTAGSPVLFPRWLYPKLQNLPPDQGGSVIMKAHKKYVRMVEALHSYELQDADTPDALEKLLKSYRLTASSAPSQSFPE